MTVEGEKLTLEVQGRIWEDELARRVEGGEERAVLIVKDTPAYEVWRKLRRIGPRPYIKYDNVGNIYIMWHQPKKTRLGEDERRVLINPEGAVYRVLSPKYPRPDYLNNLPKDKQVVERVIGKSEEGIEAAIRQSSHILGHYEWMVAESEVTQARRVIEHLDRLADRFVTASVSREDLQLLARETYGILEEVNIVEPRNPRKIKMLQNMMTAVAVDRLGRVNPLVARTRIRAAHIAATGRLIEQSLIIGKFESIRHMLIYKRETIRWTLKRGMDQLDSVLRHHAFERRGGEVATTQRAIIASVIKNIAEEYFGVALLKPYLAPSVWAAVNLVGCRKEKEQLVTNILGADIAGRLFAQTPATEFAKDGEFEEVRRRVRLSQAAIRKTLTKYAETGDKRS